jgi:hypothetical protein
MKITSRDNSCTLVAGKVAISVRYRQVIDGKRYYKASVLCDFVFIADFETETRDLNIWEAVRNVMTVLDVGTDLGFNKPEMDKFREHTNYHELLALVYEYNQMRAL